MPDTEQQLIHPRFAGDPILEQVARGAAVLKRGSRGPSIRTIQNALKDMRFNLFRWENNGRAGGGPDGSFGRQTETALINFQAHASRFFPDLSMDGILGARTMRALDALAPPEGRTAGDGSTRAPGHLWQGDGRYPLRVVVVKQEHRTFLLNCQGVVEAIYPNATGAMGSETDAGFKKIIGRLDEKAAAQVGQQLWQDPTAFGSRILNLSWADGRSSGEELHGTNRPDQLGMNVSHGCVRHYNPDIIDLYNRVALNDLVAIVEWIDDPRLQAQRIV